MIIKRCCFVTRVGIGSEVHVYETINKFECLATFQCLTAGTMIRGIRFLNRSLSKQDNIAISNENETVIVVFGQKESVSFIWNRSVDIKDTNAFLEYWRMVEAKDWIWDVMIGNITGAKLQLVRISAHNVLEIWDFSSQQLVQTISSPENSILYSASLYHSTERGLLVACGTVFNQVF